MDPPVTISRAHSVANDRNSNGRKNAMQEYIAERRGLSTVWGEMEKIAKGGIARATLALALSQ